MKRISFNLEDIDYEVFRRICKRDGKKPEAYLQAFVKAFIRQRKTEKPKLSRKDAEVKFYRELE